MYSNNIEELKMKIKNYMVSYEKENVVNYIKNQCKDSYKETLKGANLLLNNSFVFDEAWDMEQCKIPYVNRKLDWNYTPNGDEEWTFMLNRQEYIHKLIVAYYVESNDAYINKCKDLIMNWIDNNEIKEGKTTRTIDTGIRCLSWMYTLIHLINEDKINDDEILKIVLSIVEQLNYLKDSYIDKYILSNWGVLQTTSIVISYFYLDNFISNDLFDWALDELYKQIDIQVFDDGSHWEQSVMYHVEVLNCCIKAIHMSEVFKFELKEEFKNKVHYMAKYLMYCGGPNSHQEAQGDSDRTDIRDVLVKAATIFNDGELKKNAFEKMDLSSIFLLGYDYNRKYLNLAEKEITNLNKSFEDSGNIYIRSSFENDASFTYIQNGTLGSGHGHSDLGHFSIHYKGKPFIIDTGRYTYVEEDPIREYLKSAKAHNVSVIDNMPFAIPNKSWGYDLYADVLKNYFREKEEVVYAELPYLAELKDGTPYTVIRKIMIISKNIWIIVNDIRCKGKHVCKNYYNFDNNVIIQQKDSYIKCRNDDTIINVCNYNIDKCSIKKSIISKNYNEINNSNKLVTKTNFIDKLINYDVIVGEENNREIVVKDAEIRQFNNKNKISDDVAIVKEIEVGYNESYVVIIFNKETYKGGKVYFYEDIPVYGKGVVIHKINGKHKTIFLKG